MNKKILIGVLLLFVIAVGTMSFVAADNTTATYQGSKNGVFTYKTAENKELIGYCIDSNRAGPSQGKEYTVSEDTSALNNKIKEVIVKNYRGNNASQASINSQIQNEIWEIRNYNTTSRFANITGTMDIGDTYQLNDGVFIHNFKFFYGNPGTSTIQQMMMFDYFATLIPVITPELPEIPETPETPETPVNPDTPTDDTPVVVDEDDDTPETPTTPEAPAEETPETVDDNPNSNLPQSPAEPVTPDTPDTPETVTPSAPGPSETPTPEAKAAVAHAGTAMKKTGLPILPALLVLIASLSGVGLGIRRKY